MMSALVSVVPCPNCGGLVLVPDLGSAGAPAPEPVTCDICGLRLQVKTGRGTGEIIIEEVKAGRRRHREQE